ncbi:hypothetical protein CLOP_g3960, partial [Closterium sp. NIES-67]
MRRGGARADMSRGIVIVTPGLDAVFKAARASGTLNLSGNDLKEVPPEVYSLLDDVPQTEKWWESVELQKVLLSQNSLTQVSEEIGRLPCLTWIDVSYNALARLPAAIGKLVELKSLLASHNKLEALPEEIGGATNLVKLDVSHNALESLPLGLASCTLLAHLEASANRIVSLPASLAACTALSHLNLE